LLSCSPSSNIRGIISVAGRVIKERGSTEIFRRVRSKLSEVKKKNPQIKQIWQIQEKKSAKSAESADFFS
jgi:hypothetical protein